MSEFESMNTRESEENKKRGYAIASMVVGIVGASTILFGWFFWSLVCGIVALILSSVAVKNNQRCGMQKAGRICGMIALIIGGILTVITIATTIGLVIYANEMTGEIAAASKDVINGLGAV